MSFKHATDRATHLVLLWSHLGGFTSLPSLADGGHTLVECNHILLFKDGAGEAGKPEGRTHKVCPKSLGPEVLQ